MVSFFRRYMSGEVGEDAIHDHIDAWHKGDSAKPLSAYLGLTDCEYGAWVEDPRCLPQLVKERLERLTECGMPLDDEGQPTVLEAT